MSRCRLSKRFEFHRWRADLLGSHLSGLGDDKAQALADAKVKIAAYVDSGGILQRPGSKLKVTFASSEAVNLYPDLQKHFVNTVLEIPWAFLSDESTLWDFHGELDNDLLLKKIWEVYGVDVSYIENGNIAQILTVIMNEIRDFPEDEINRAIRMDREARIRHISGPPHPKWIQDEIDEEDRRNGIV